MYRNPVITSSRNRNRGTAAATVKALDPRLQYRNRDLTEKSVPSQQLFLSAHVHAVKYHSTLYGAAVRGGTDMKNQLLLGYQVFKKNQVRVKSGLGPRKTVPENTCITSEVIYRHKGLEYMSSTTPN